MFRRLLTVSLLAGAALVVSPIIGHVVADAGSAQAADMAVKKKPSKKSVKKVNKYQYQYVPTSSGPPGAWR